MIKTLVFGAMKSEKSRHRRGRKSLSSKPAWQFSLFTVFVFITISAVLLKVGASYPLETLLCVGIVVVCAICVALNAGEYVVVGWVVDFASWLTTPRPKQPPLEYEQAGEIIVVKLRDNIVTAGQCQAVQKQLKRLIDEHHCDFILDFSCAGRISIRFREVMIRLLKAARREAGRLGKPCRPVSVPPGDVFTVFDCRERAVEEMGQHDGHGWVVLCSVPPGVRAVSEAT